VQAGSFGLKWRDDAVSDDRTVNDNDDNGDAVQCQVARGPYHRIKPSLHTAESTGENSQRVEGGDGVVEADSAIRTKGRGTATVDQARGLKSRKVQHDARCKTHKG